MMESAEVKLDFQRHQRLGISEAVLCAQKSPAQIGEILDQARAGGETLLLTRLGAEKAAELAPEQQRRLDYDPVSETAFFMPRGEDFDLRWFTPATEVDLCGHATLATGALILQKLEPERERARFHTRSGVLEVSRDGDLMVMDFPAWQAEPTRPY